MSQIAVTFANSFFAKMPLTCIPLFPAADKAYGYGRVGLETANRLGIDDHDTGGRQTGVLYEVSTIGIVAHQYLPYVSAAETELNSTATRPPPRAAIVDFHYT